MNDASKVTTLAILVVGAAITLYLLSPWQQSRSGTPAASASASAGPDPATSARLRGIEATLAEHEAKLKQHAEGITELRNKADAGTRGRR